MFNCILLCLQLLTYGRRIPVAELFARIDAVDASTVKRIANRFIFDQVKTSLLSRVIKMMSDTYADLGLRYCLGHISWPFEEQN